MNLFFQTLYFLVPVAFANMAPVLVRKHFQSLNKPLDFNKKLNGKRILGDHKTFRGLIFGILGGVLGVLLQSYLFQFSFFKELSLINYNEINIFLFGFLIGLGVIVGDAVGSFIKRRINLKPGQSSIPLDQIVAPFGAMILLLPIYNVGWKLFLLALFISFFFHILIKRIGYALKIEDKKW
ncbi:MAG: CDP-archaeol synthase [Candidatus Nanoarchaeia archaeon]